MELPQRKAIYLWYYFNVQRRQIFWYRVPGMAWVALISVFLKERIHGACRNLGKNAGVVGVFLSCLLGIAFS